MSRLNEPGDKIYHLHGLQSGASTASGGRRKPNVRRVVTFGLLAALIALLCGTAIFMVGPGGLNRLDRFASGDSQALPTAPNVEGARDAQEAAPGQAVAANPSIRVSQLLSTSAELGTTETGEETSEKMGEEMGEEMGEAQTSADKDAAQVLAAAEAAFARQAWEEALSLYIEVRGLDSAYESALVSERLALAYRNAALMLLANSPEVDADLETARRYLREALILNPNDVVAVQESELLAGYLAGVRSLQFGEPGEAIEALLRVYETRADYLDGLAAQQLYHAYVALGDISYRRGETSVARDLYKRAAALNLEGMEDANVRLTSMDELVKLTPTPYPANLATVQAVAVERGLPPVLLPTPTPASMAEATARAEYATAVAVTTGTFTPEPDAYVTPFVVYPPPPVENMATEVARAVEATARASEILVPTNTPMPYNAVMGEYVYATPVPENAATAEAQAVIAEGNLILYGTPTPMPWNAIVITPVPPEPTPLPPPPTIPPTSTPVPLLVPVTELTATPTPIPTLAPPADFPQELRGKIVFLSDRGGETQVYLLDPATGAVNLVTQGWVYPMAQEQLVVAPDGVRQAVVLADNNQVLQIQIFDTVYETTHQVTAVRTAQNPGAMAYDPAWSPNRETIAYVSSEFQGDEIYTINLGDSIPRRLTNNTWEWDKHPTWSPDGSQIVFFSNRESGRSQLWIMNADGSDQRNLSSNEYNDWNPIWIR